MQLHHEKPVTHIGLLVEDEEAAGSGTAVNGSAGVIACQHGSVCFEGNEKLDTHAINLPMVASGDMEKLLCDRKDRNGKKRVGCTEQKRRRAGPGGWEQVNNVGKRSAGYILPRKLLLSQ